MNASLGIRALSVAMGAVFCFVLSVSETAGQDRQSALEDVRKLCSGGFGTLAEGERATISYNNSTLSIESGNRVEVFDENGKFTRDISIDFSEYTECLKQMIESLGLSQQSEPTDQSNLFRNLNLYTPANTVSEYLGPPIVSFEKGREFESFRAFEISQNKYLFRVEYSDAISVGVLGQPPFPRMPRLFPSGDYSLKTFRTNCGGYSMSSAIDLSRVEISYTGCDLPQLNRGKIFASFSLSGLKKECADMKPDASSEDAFRRADRAFRNYLSRSRDTRICFAREQLVGMSYTEGKTEEIRNGIFIAQQFLRVN